MNPKEMAICHVIKNGTILLIKAGSGLSKDKWNAPSGYINPSEKPNKSAMRHIFQQTGLYANKVVNHGTIRLFLNGKLEYDYKLHVFSTKIFAGNLKPNIQGEAKWFNVSEIPYYEMWADDKYWINLVLQGKKFDADFFFDEKNEKVVKYQIRERKEILKKAVPILAVLAVIGVVLFGIASSGILNHSIFPPTSPTTKNTVAFHPSVSSTSVTTTASTTIQPPNINRTITGTPRANQTYIYYIVTSGNPPVTQVYYSTGNGSGISNWRLIAGNPINLRNATCSVYNAYIYCTGTSGTLAPPTYNNTAANTTTAKQTANVIRIGNPVCLALHPPDPNICYNTYIR